VHFDNPEGNIGPIVAINVFDPATHKKDSATTVALSFVNGRATIKSDTIILDTLVLADKVEGTDFSIDYSFDKGLVIINSIGEAITGSVNATYSEVDASAITAQDIIGEVTEAGVYSGFGCIELIYGELNLIPNLVLAPGWSEKPEVYKAMLKAASKINNHWNAITYADIPLVDDGTKVDTIPLAIQWKKDNAYNDAFSKVFFPQNIYDGKIYHASTLAAWATMFTDAMRDGVPMESPSNKVIPATAHYFGEGSTNRGFDQSRANELNANGISNGLVKDFLKAVSGDYTVACWVNGRDIEDLQLMAAVDCNDRSIFDLLAAYIVYEYDARKVDTDVYALNLNINEEYNYYTGEYESVTRGSDYYIMYKDGALMLMPENLYNELNVGGELHPLKNSIKDNKLFASMAEDFVVDVKPIRDIVALEVDNASEDDKAALEILDMMKSITVNFNIYSLDAKWNLNDSSVNSLKYLTDKIVTLVVQNNLF
jgi:hypothetical protein